MVEFILWVIFTKIVSQVVIVKKIVIVEKNWNNWKGIFSSNINEFIKTVLNLLFFLRKDFTRTESATAPKAPKGTKSTKRHKKHQKALKPWKHTQAKATNANEQAKTKNALENI